MNKKKWIQLAVAIIICELAGIIGSIFTSPAIGEWYATLLKPDLAPPNWVFAPVWTTLFLMMGIALFLVWQKNWNTKEKRLALLVFALQLSLNVLWSALFFGQRDPAAAFTEIIFLWLAIVFTIDVFAKISKPAAWLLVPYLLWVTFAAYLNYSFTQLYVLGTYIWRVD